MEKSSLVAIAQETLAAIRGGALPGGAPIGEMAARAVAGTELIEAGDRIEAAAVGAGARAGLVEVTRESTNDAAERLVLREGAERVGVLNFASARKPGGGFLTGASAQEECLCRTSALFECLIQPKVESYYQTNRAERSCLYTDAMIYSPQVPFFRRTRYDWLEKPYVVDVLTAPAPNRGAIENNTPEDLPLLEETFRRRIRRALELFRRRDARTIVLGAWGCGAFRNDSAQVAEWFRGELLPRRGHFDRIVFAVFDPKEEKGNFAAFERALAAQ